MIQCNMLKCSSEVCTILVPISNGRFSMVTCCSQTRRIWVGSRNGSLAFYELKQNGKCQVITAHEGPVIAVSVSPDGKFLATYSHVDHKLKFWQVSLYTISLFFGVKLLHYLFLFVGNVTGFV